METIDPDFTARREVAAFTILADSDVPTPALIGADEEGKECDVPANAMTRLPGHPEPSSVAELDDGKHDGRPTESLEPHLP